MGKKILLADDSITIQKVIELTFSDEDFEVVTVGNGRLAVDRVAEVRPDVVLCDIIMPEKDGYEVCDYIKKNPSLSHIPVLLLTGAFEPFDQERHVPDLVEGRNDHRQVGRNRFAFYWTIGGKIGKRIQPGFSASNLLIRLFGT